MAFPDEVDGLVITRDSRAASRGRGTPTKITVTHKAGSRVEVIRTALASKNPPFALVGSDGHVHILSAGGTGSIWTHGTPSDEQDDAVKILSAAMTEAFNIKPAVKKKAAAKKAEPVEDKPYDGFLSKFRDADTDLDSFGVGRDPF